MFPVRFPSMICQWNMSWDRDYCSQDAQAPPFLPDWEGMGPLERRSLPLTICNWRLGLPTFCKMAAARKETRRGP